MIPPAPFFLRDAFMARAGLERLVAQLPKQPLAWLPELHAQTHQNCPAAVSGMSFCYSERTTPSNQGQSQNCTERAKSYSCICNHLHFMESGTNMNSRRAYVHLNPMDVVRTTRSSLRRAIVFAYSN